MEPTTVYIMRDQVRDLIPDLTHRDRPRRDFTLRNWLELCVFVLAVSAYVTALTLVA